MSTKFGDASIAGALILAMTGGGYAQGTQKDSIEKVEKISVVGSRIKRIDIEGTTPIKIIDREEIENSGLVSIGDIIRKSALASPTGNFSGSSRFIAAGSSSIDLLGLGSDRTLILLNGKRLPPSANGGLNSVNIDNIPTGLVERIEILSGGSSAVYGADAVGGVVNVVLKKDMSGSEVSAFRSVTNEGGGDETELSASYGGKLTDKLSLTFSLGYRGRSRLFKNNRDLSFGEAPRDFTVTNPPEGTYSYRPIDLDATDSIFLDWQPSSNCPEQNRVATVPTSPNNVYCAGPRSGPPTELIPRKEEFHGSLYLDYDISDDWKLSGLVNGSSSYNSSNTGNFLSYIDSPYDNANVLVTGDRARELGIDVSDDIEYVQLITKSFESPDRKSRARNTSFGGIANLEGSLANDWNIEFSSSYFRTKGTREGVNYINSDKLYNIVVNPNDENGANPAWLAIDPNRDNSLLLDVFDGLKSSEINSHLSADAFLSNEFFALPGGLVSAGFGASVTNETYNQIADQKDQQFNAVNTPVFTGSFASEGKGDRQVGALFGEFLAPVTSQIDVEGALRFDSYSDFGDSLNFGLGTKAELIPGLAVRGRVASSYKAPPLSFIHRKGSGGYLTIRDTVNCQRENDAGRTCDPSSPTRQVLVADSGNKDLNPETGLSQTLGLIFEPSSNLNLIGDFYAIDLKDTYQQDDIQELADKWYKQNPGNTQGGQIDDNGIEVDKDGVITQILRPYRNLGKIRVRATSLQANFSQKFGGLKLGASSRYFRMLSYKVQETVDAPVREQVGYDGVPDWRVSNQINFGFGSHTITLYSSTIAGQSIDPELETAASKDTHIDKYTEYDVSYNWDTPWDSNLVLGVNNVLNTIGGIDNGTFNKSESINTSLYSYSGRTFFARLTQRF